MGAVPILKRLIIYDLDGTLVDTKQDIAEAANYMLGQMGRPTLPTDTICRYVGRGLHELMKGCMGSDDPRDVERGTALFRAFYATHLLDHSRLYPHAIDLLQHFQSRAQAVITNKPDPYTHHILQGLGIADYFFSIIAGDAGYPKKPDPTSVQVLIGQATANPLATVLVGDSPIDIQAGRNAGVLTVGVAQGFAEDDELTAARPDVLVRNFQELLALARGQAW